MYVILVQVIAFALESISIDGARASRNELGLTFGHTWDKGDDRVTVYFDISNSTFDKYTSYYFDFRPFAQPNHLESFPRQRLTDGHNALHVLGLHENDYVSCVSFVDQLGNVVKPRYACYEFTLGEKISGSHHAGSSGYLSPLLLAFVFVIHVFIAVVHHIKAKQYAQKLLHRFTDVNPKARKRILSVKHSLKQLDQPRISASVQRRLSRISIDGHRHGSLAGKLDRSLPVYTLPQTAHQRASLAGMKTIPEHHV